MVHSSKPAWPYKSPVTFFAIDRSRGPQHIHLVAATLVDGKVTALEHGPDNLEGIVGGQAQSHIQNWPIMPDQVA